MTKAKFDGYAADYDSWFIANENVFLSELKLLKLSLDLAGVAGDGSDSRILSVGCGSGLFEKALKDEYGLTVTEGVEPSEDMAAIARKRGMEVQIGTAETADLPADAYDVIYFNGSSSYIPDLTVAYRNCLDALKSGGKLVLIDVPKESAYGLMYLLASVQDGYSSHELEGTMPELPYPIELAKSAYWHTTEEKIGILTDQLGLKNLKYAQTLVANPVYTNRGVEEPTEGYTKGGYVAIVAEK
ncbi:class I SAM-dependent methyltransferase [Bifidobacterium callitrichidarum]|uniref:SAM-dependent methyltransferase n=1 Tax=Bifidobacterium callitrichidarum TaxID=2052941 RepID=A0A2U2NB74_9BIFI|nr:class I SAM-dependent methyltransferase [Bifidobacterium callitrichidarum]PWG66330.1 SAM-dependent methyltransferase [Bifidobacterium callitrichidarum]